MDLIAFPRVSFHIEFALNQIVQIEYALSFPIETNQFFFPIDSFLQSIGD